MAKITEELGKRLELGAIWHKRREEGRMHLTVVIPADLWTGLELALSKPLGQEDILKILRGLTSGEWMLRKR